MRPRPILSKNWEKSRYREVSRRDVTLWLPGALISSKCPNIPKQWFSCSKVQWKVQKYSSINNTFLAPRWTGQFKKYSEYCKTIIPLLQSTLNSSQVFKLKIFFLQGALLKQFKNIKNIPKQSIFTVNQINNKIFTNNDSAKDF